MDRFKTFPEELTREVLANALDVPTDEEFFRFDGGLRHGFRGARWHCDTAVRASERRPPALLLVCKDWQRIGAPLLYRTAIIRSKGQAQALSTTITTYRPELAACVKRVRLEGAFGMEVFRLLKATTLLTDLALVLNLYADESVSPLLRALQADYVSPEVLVLADAAYSSKNRAKLIDTLLQVIRKWSKLRTVHMPCITSRYNRSQGPQTAAIVKRLSTIPSLRTVVFPDKDRPALEVLQVLARNPSLRCIFFSVNGGDTYWSKREYKVDEEVVGDPRLSAICVYDTPGGRQVRALSSLEIMRRALIREREMIDRGEEPKKESEPEPPTPTAPLPLLAHPLEVQEIIWRRVFDFVEELCWPWNHNSMTRKLAHVCQLFRRIRLPRVYHCLTSAGWKRTRHLMRTLTQHPDLTQHVRELCLGNCLDGTRYFDMQGLLENTPHITSIQATGYYSWTWKQSARDKDSLRMTWSAFTALPRMAEGLENIRGLKIAKEHHSPPTEPESNGLAGAATASSTAATRANHATIPSSIGAPVIVGEQDRKKPIKKELTIPIGPLTPFRALKVLHFEPSVKLKFKKGEISGDVFPVLEDLGFTSCHTSALKLFTIFELPRLRHLALHGRAQTGQDAGDFLERHGPKLDELDITFFPTETVLEMCTSLTTLCVRERKPPPDYTADKWRSATLRVVRFPESTSTQIQAMRPWGAILSSLDQVKLPQFSELYMGCRWPTDERAIAGSFWVPYAEELLEKGIEMRDTSDLPWTPRVKARQKKRKRSSTDIGEAE